MRRTLLALAALAAAAFTALTLAVPADATTTTDIFHYKSQSAYATWWTTTTTPTGGRTETGTAIAAYDSNHGSDLFAAQATTYFDANDNVLSRTYFRGTTWSTFSLSVGQSLASASLSVTGLAGTKDVWDSEGNITSTDVTVGAVTAAWTGQGKASRYVENYQRHEKGYTYTNHNQGTSRPATATGTFGGSALSADQLTDCGMGDFKSGTISITVGY